MSYVLLFLSETEFHTYMEPLDLYVVIEHNNNLEQILNLQPQKTLLSFGTCKTFILHVVVYYI